MTSLKTKIYSILEKYKRDINHAKQIKKLSLMLFDQTNGILHDYSKNKRKLLKVGALLHDVGYYKGVEKHNRSSYELIIENKLDEFSDDEMLIIANIARHHRGRVPKEDHECYQGFSKSKYRKQSLKLASFVRFMDALDRRGFTSAVDKIECVYHKKEQILHIKVISIDSVDSKFFTPDMDAIIRKKDLFERMFEVQVVVTFGDVQIL